MDQRIPRAPKAGYGSAGVHPEEWSAAYNCLSKGVHFQPYEVYEGDKMVYGFNQVRNADEN